MQDDERDSRIEEVIQPVLSDHGLSLVDLEWRPHRPRGVLRIFVDKPAGVRVADCERVSREIGDVLDVSGLISDGYDLEVSSPGLDRQLRTDREYPRAPRRRSRTASSATTSTSRRGPEPSPSRTWISTRAPPTA